MIGVVAHVSRHTYCSLWIAEVVYNHVQCTSELTPLLQMLKCTHDSNTAMMVVIMCIVYTNWTEYRAILQCVDVSYF